MGRASIEDCTDTHNAHGLEVDVCRHADLSFNAIRLAKHRVDGRDGGFSPDVVS